MIHVIIHGNIYFIYRGLVTPFNLSWNYYIIFLLLCNQSRFSLSLHYLIVKISHVSQFNNYDLRTSVFSQIICQKQNQSQGDINSPC